MINFNCVTGTLAPYEPGVDAPWNKRRIQHLYRRLGFGLRPDQLEAALDAAPSEWVDALIDAAIDKPLPAEPEWAYWTVADYESQEQAIEQIGVWRRQWLTDMLTDGVRERIALFWHNHFVTRLNDYNCPSYLYQYHRLLQQYALGNFRDFVYEIGKTPAMLVFLNGIQNTRFSPNENYARELYELFTLGADNGYTQADIVDTARALTGWNGVDDYCGPIDFVPFLHDDGADKTIFGQTGNWGYDEVHEILFNQRGELIAEYICRKIYAFFVSPEVDETIVGELAGVFLENDFELAPVFRQLFKSEHFFDDAIIGIKVKSPLDFHLHYLVEGNFTFEDQQLLDGLLYLNAQLGQDLFNPVDVAGWQGDRSWVDSNTMTGRWQSLRLFLFYAYENYPAELVDLARNLTNDSNDPYFIVQQIVEHFLPNGLQTADAYDRATTVFKGEIPENYYEDGQWSLYWDTAPAQVALLLDHLLRQPEFQLT